MRQSYADDFKEIIGILAYGRPTNGVPPQKCIALAPLVGDCRMRFYAGDFNSSWCDIEWDDGSKITLNMEDEG